MKLKHLLGIAFVAAVGGFIVYQLFNKKERRKTTSDNGMIMGSSEETLQEGNVASNDEAKCDETMCQVYESMSIRNEEAKDILAGIHDDIKKSEDNIASKKSDIEKMMEDLKNKLGD